MRKMMFNVLMCLSLVGMGAVQINDVVVQQRYPWNGQVDISFNVNCAPTVGVGVHVNVFPVGGDIPYPFLSWTIDGGKPCSYANCLSAGRHMITWDSTQDVSELNTNVTVQLTGTLNPIAGAIGEPTHIFGDMLILDLETMTSRTYPNVDTGTLNCDLFKTTQLPFRRIPAGEYPVMGCVGYPENKAGWTNITFTTDYYMSLFEMTFQHLALANQVVLEPTNHLSKVAHGQLSYQMICKLCTNVTKRLHNLEMCLPTLAQWRVASFANSPLTSGRFAGCDPLEAYAWVTQGKNPETPDAWGLYEVGLLKPNPWGFYDVYGNGADAIGEFYSPIWPTEFVDPKGPPADLGTASNGAVYYYAGGSVSSSGTYSCQSGCIDRWFMNGFSYNFVVFRPILRVLSPASTLSE